MNKHSTPFEALGEEKIRDLASNFYDIMNDLPSASSIRAMHAKDLSGIKAMLAEFLITWMGGPNYFLERRGSLCLTDSHSKYKISEHDRDQWMLCMDMALDSIECDIDTKEMLKQPFFQIADMLTNT
jgi:hemoglobin